MTWRMHKTKDKRWRERCLTPSMVKSRSQTFQLCCFCHVWAKRSRTEPEYQNRSMRNPPRRDQSLTACCTPPHGLHPPAHRLFHFSSQGGSSWIINTAPSSFSTTASKLELSADLSGQLLPTGVLRPAANLSPEVQLCSGGECRCDLSFISISSSTCWLSVEELGRVNKPSTGNDQISDLTASKYLRGCPEVRVEPSER